MINKWIYVSLSSNRATEQQSNRATEQGKHALRQRWYTYFFEVFFHKMKTHFQVNQRHILSKNITVNSKQVSAASRFLKCFSWIFVFWISNILNQTAYAISLTNISLPIKNTMTIESNYDMQLTKAYLEEKLPNLTALDDYHKAAMLRNFIYANTIRDSDGDVSPDLVPMTYEAFLHYVTGKSPLLCGGMSMEYSALLSLYDIPSRLVLLATEDSYKNKTNDTHVAIEVYVNGRWMIQDPTFNIHWALNGEPLNTLDLAHAFSIQNEPVADSDGYSLLPNKPSVENYYLPYQQFLAHFTIAHYTMWGPEPCEGRMKIDMIYPAQEEEPVTPISVAEGATVLSYNFSYGIPSDWNISDPNTTIVSQNETQSMLSTNPLDHRVATFPQQQAATTTGITALCHPFGYVLNTVTPVTLNSGHYQMIVDGEINGGGMILVVVDVESNHIVSQTPYRYDQIKKGSQIIGRPFTIEKSGQFDLILSNNATKYGEISNWTLSNIVILKITD